MLTENELRQVLDKAVSTGGDFAELYWEDKEEHNIDFSGGKPGRVTAVRTVGAGIHLMAGTKSVYVCTNDLTLPALMRAAGQAASLLGHRTGRRQTAPSPARPSPPRTRCGLRRARSIPPGRSPCCGRSTAASRG